MTMAEQDGQEFNRRAFLTLSWRGSTESAPPDGSPAPPTGTLVYLGRTDNLRALAPGEIIPSPSASDIHVVRTETGLLALRSRCPNDGALIAWRAEDRSEDHLAATGRFYCARDASIFNRLGELIAGPAGAGLPVLVIVEDDAGLWVDLASPEAPDDEPRQSRELPVSAPER